MRTLKFIAIAGLLLAGCNKNPFDRTSSGSGGGPTGTFTPANSFVIFNSELTSGGGAFEFPGSEGQTLSFTDTSNPISHRSIRYNWNGQPVSNPGSAVNPESTFAGFDLMHTPTLAQYASTPGRDLRAAGYGRVTFFARGSLSTATLIKIEVSEPSTTPGPCISLSTDGTLDDGVNPGSTACGVKGVLSTSWNQYSIPVPNADQAAIKDLFKVTFVYNAPPLAPVGLGGTVYFDVIQYQP